jgi:hypothetical protein
MATRTSTLADRAETEEQERNTHEIDRGGNLGAGVLWIVAAAAAWNVLFVLFHDVTDRFLGR